jgi:hypothetical protein
LGLGVRGQVEGACGVRWRWRTVEPRCARGALALRLDLARVELCEARSRGEWVAQLGQGAEGGGHASRAPTPKSSILHAPALLSR